MSSKKSLILFNKPNDGNFWLTNFATGSPIVAKLPTKITTSGKIATDSGFIEINGEREFTWPTSEHLFQALKFTKDNIDTDLIRQILNAPTPNEARRLGYPIGRRDWIDPTNYRLNAMKWVLHQKFTQHPKLKTMLINTEDALLVENAGARDKFWGNGEVNNGKSGLVDKSKGQNMLGELLMDLRKNFQVETGQSKIINLNSSSTISAQDRTMADKWVVDNLNKYGLKLTDLNPKFQNYWATINDLKNWDEINDWIVKMDNHIKEIAENKKPISKPNSTSSLISEGQEEVKKPNSIQTPQPSNNVNNQEPVINNNSVKPNEQTIQSVNTPQSKSANSGKFFLWMGAFFLLVFLGGIIFYWLKKKNH